jgi:FkbM family methyltransferase
MKIKILLSKLFNYFEIKFANLQGKGWGGATVDHEFTAALSLLSNKQPKLFIDIGGNKGSYTQEILKKFPNCKVVIFEPALSNMKILKEKFKDNSNVILEQLAIANDNANVILYSNEAGSGLASLTKRRLEHFAINFSHTEDIKSIKFEDYWKEKLDSKNIDFCKLDIEGHEMDAFIGFGKAINYIDLIQFEFGGCNIDTRIFFQDFWYFFKKKGFDLFRISPLGIIPITNYKESDEYFTTSNYLVKRKIT